MLRPLFIAIILGMSVGGAFAAPAVADKMAAPSVAIIDVQRILQESLAAKSVQQQIDAQRSKFQAETEKEENGLRQSEMELGKSREQANSEVYAEHEQQLRQKTLVIERHFEARRKMLDQAFADAKNSMSVALQSVVEKVAQEHSVNLVLIKQQVLWAEPSFDITDEVLNRLNKQLPQITVKMKEEVKE